MKKLSLLPPFWKRIGLFLALPGLVLGTLNVLNGFEIPGFEIRMREEGGFFSSPIENFTDELALTLVVVGFLLICYSRERIEDERVQQIRLESFQWSILVNFAIVLIGNWTLYQGHFFYLMVVNLFTPLVVFLLRFYYVLYRSEARITDEMEKSI